MDDQAPRIVTRRTALRGGGGTALALPAAPRDPRLTPEDAPGQISFTAGVPNPAPAWASVVGRGASSITVRSTLPYAATRRW